MIRLALWEPEIPPNTGNIARLCAATGTPLHLIGRLGFRIDDKSVRRAGLDYWGDVEMHLHRDLRELESSIQLAHSPYRIICLSAHATLLYTQMNYEPGDVLLLGSESRGLPDEVLERHRDTVVTIPMPTKKVRSLNLATAAGIVLYEALRQLHKW